MKKIFDEFNKENPFLFDGAFGTYYFSMFGERKNCEYANKTNVNTVEKIHSEYILAGANGIKTNTFGANILNFKDEDTRDEIIRSGYEIATKAAKGTQAKVFADIGYIDADSIKASEQFDPENEYVSIVRQFLQAGADNFIFETLAEFENILPALEHIRTIKPDAFIVVCFAVSQDGFTRKGHYYKTLLKAADENVCTDVVGLNCVCGPVHLKDLIVKIDGMKKPLCAMPNSGYPANINGRTVFTDNSEYFAETLLKIYDNGIYFLGGCCGTTPSHIENAVKKITSRQINGKKPEEKVIVSDSSTLSKRRINSFLDKLESGKKVIAVEIDPPSDADDSFVLDACKKAKNAMADIITVADSPLARPRADSFMLAAKIKREANIEAMPHLSCRDKNHIALRGSLLAGYIENIFNVLAVTGDPVAENYEGGTKGVFTMNSYRLISYIRSMNEELFAQGPILVSAALNVNSPNFNAELERAKKKIDAGAKVFFTQPVFSQRSAENLIHAKSVLDTRIMAGILPVAGYKNALFLNNEVSGIQIPDEFLESLKNKTRDAVFELAVEFGMNIVEKTFDYCDGYYLMTPLKRIEPVCELALRIFEKI